MKSAGDITDRSHASSGFREGAKRNVKGSPAGSPWLYGRPNDANHSRTSSNKQGVGPARPSAAIPGSIYGGKQKGASRADQGKHI